MSDKAPTARALARETVRARILAAARVRLTEEGPAQLSLRAVARDVGLVSLRLPVLPEPGRPADGAARRGLRRARRRGRVRRGAGRPRRPPRPLDGGVPGDPDVGDLPPRRLRTALRLTRARLRRTAGHDRAGLAHHARAHVRIVTDAWSGPDGAAPRDRHGPAVGDPVRGRPPRSPTRGLHTTARLPRRSAPPSRAPPAHGVDHGVRRPCPSNCFGHAVGSVSDPDAYFDEVVVRLAHDLASCTAEHGRTASIGASG